MSTCKLVAVDLAYELADTQVTLESRARGLDGDDSGQGLQGVRPALDGDPEGRAAFRYPHGAAALESHHSGLEETFISSMKILGIKFAYPFIMGGKAGNARVNRSSLWLTTITSYVEGNGRGRDRAIVFQVAIFNRIGCIYCRWLPIVHWWL